MPHARNRRNNGKPDDIPFTPMIDVVFQLMIYFVLTFQIPKALAQVPVFRPVVADGPICHGPRTHIHVLEHGYLANERPADLETMRGWLQALGQLDQDIYVTITVSPDADHGRLMDLLNACMGANLSNFAVMTTP